MGHLLALALLAPDCLVRAWRIQLATRSEERRVGKECVTRCRYVTGVQTCALPICWVTAPTERDGSPPRARVARARLSGPRLAYPARHQIGRASCRERVCNEMSLRDWSSDVCSSDLLGDCSD